MARFMRKGTAKFRWIPSIASSAAPTTAEVTAGIDLTAQLAEVNGFMFKNNPIDTPDMAVALVTKIPGEDSLDDSSLVFYELIGTNTIKTTLAKNTNGFIGIYYGGIAGATPAAADVLEVWPVTISSNSRKYTAGNEAAQFEVAMAITGAPVEAVQAA